MQGRAPAINTPSSDLLTQKGSLAGHQIPENLGRRDSLTDPLTPAAASEILRAERKHCQLCLMKEGMAVPAAWITGKENASCSPHSFCSLLFP